MFTSGLHILQCPLLSPSQSMPPFSGLGTKYSKFNAVNVRSGFVRPVIQFILHF